MHRYLHILDRNELSDGTQILHVNELPPPYSATQTQQSSLGDDWKSELIEIKPMNDQVNRYGFVIGGGIDAENGPSIIVTHIDYCSNISIDNGRSKLRLFDHILSINDIDLTHVIHDEAVRIFSLVCGQSVVLHIRRLCPTNIEHIDILLPSDISNISLGITFDGGLDINSKDPGLFITKIDPYSLLASVTKKNQLQIGDRLLEIKTNYTSANLQRVTRSMGAQLIRRICQDSHRITLVVAHQNSTI